METMFAIEAKISKKTSNGVVWSTERLPTFYLDSKVSGVVTERDAEHVAMEVLKGYRKPGVVVRLNVIKLQFKVEGVR